MVPDQPRLSAQTLKVLGAIMSAQQDELSGADVGRATKLASGTLYPILLRLEQAGWLESRWEAEDPQKLGRPRRRFYRLTELGIRRARAAFSELEPAFRRFSWT
jgi:PadR family transcriptional regulator, regulatory protein PadR